MANTKVPVELSSTPSIVDNGNATAITIDSSENVGIGETSPDKQLHIKDSGAVGIAIESTDNAQNLDIDFYNNVGSAQGRIRYSEGAGTFGFAPNVSADDALTIDYSGNVLVGKTSTSTDVVGSAIYNYGTIGATRDGSHALDLGRKSSDGDIAIFRKDGTLVGSIGTAGNDIYIAGLDNNHAALRLAANSKTVLPVTNAGALSDNTTDLGQSSARFKDLYLSGNAIADNFVGTNDTDTFIAMTGSNLMRFFTGNSERMRIASNGRTSIGTTTTNAGLTVANGDIRATGAAFANDANSISMSQESSGGVITARGSSTATRGSIALSVNKSNGGDGITGLKIENDGGLFAFGIAYASASSDVNYNASTGEIFVVSSSRRYKSNITDLNIDTSKILSLRPVSYIDNESETNSVGLIAEEVHEEIPQLVNYKEIEGYDEIQPDSVKYSTLSVYLLKAIQEQQELINNLTARIEQLEN